MPGRSPIGTTRNVNTEVLASTRKRVFRARCEGEAENAAWERLIPKVEDVDFEALSLKIANLIESGRVDARKANALILRVTAGRVSEIKGRLEQKMFADGKPVGISESIVWDLLIPEASK